MLNIKGFKVKYNEKRDIYQVYKDRKVCYFRDLNQIERYALKLFNSGVSWRDATKQELYTFCGGNVYNMSNYTYTNYNLSDSIDVVDVESTIDDQL